MKSPIKALLFILTFLLSLNCQTRRGDLSPDKEQNMNKPSKTSVFQEAASNIKSAFEEYKETSAQTGENIPEKVQKALDDIDNVDEEVIADGLAELSTMTMIDTDVTPSASSVNSTVNPTILHGIGYGTGTLLLSLSIAGFFYGFSRKEVTSAETIFKKQVQEAFSDHNYVKNLTDKQFNSRFNFRLNRLKKHLVGGNREPLKTLDDLKYAAKRFYFELKKEYELTRLFRFHNDTFLTGNEGDEHRSFKSPNEIDPNHKMLAEYKDFHEQYVKNKNNNSKDIYEAIIKEKYIEFLQEIDIEVKNGAFAQETYSNKEHIIKSLFQVTEDFGKDKLIFDKYLTSNKLEISRVKYSSIQASYKARTISKPAIAIATVLAASGITAIVGTALNLEDDTKNNYPALRDLLLKLANIEKSLP